MLNIFLKSRHIVFIALRSPFLMYKFALVLNSLLDGEFLTVECIGLYYNVSEIYS